MNLSRLLKTCLKIKKGENVLIVTDDEKLDIGKKLEEAARKLSDNTVLIKMKPGLHHGQEPPKHVAMAMEASDVVIMPTAMSLSHTDARKSACKKGARIVSLPGIEEKMLKKGGLSADYNEVKKISDRVAKMLTKAEQIEIKTKKGTEFEASLKGRKGWSDAGILRKGGFSNLPAGEGFIAPVEGKSNGKITFDGSFGELGVLKDPIKIWIEKGNVVHASHENLVHKLKECGADRIAEIGIGTNPKARIIGNVLEDEKVLGTVHIGLGDNHTFGGMIRSKTHWDGIVKKPTVLLDGKVIMEDGKFVACSIKC